MVDEIVSLAFYASYPQNLTIEALATPAPLTRFIKDMMTMPLQIIGAGFGRTGTQSLKQALERLGFGPCHHMSEVVENPEQTRLWTEAAQGRPDYDAIFDGYAAAVDFPAAVFWQDILAHYPSARVILSWRPAEEWYESFSNTILPLVLDESKWSQEARPWFQMVERVVVGRALGGRTDRDSILRAYESNERAARALAERGAALVFEAKQGWGPLCSFLGVDEPSEPYPRTNARADFFDTVNDATRT